MSATQGFTQFTSLAAVQQPGSSPAPIRRSILLNMTSGGIENFSGNQAAGLGTVLEAGIVAYNGTSNAAAGGISVTNTVNSDSTLALYSGNVRFTNAGTQATFATGYVISTL